MQIFISWSGGRSCLVGENFQKLIQTIFEKDNIVVWMSKSAIEPGERWSDKIDKALKNSDLGIICITSENLHSPWILYEAGALGNSIDVQGVIPYLLDVSSSELPSPLRRFQSRVCDKDGTFDLMRVLNRLQRDPLSRKDLAKRFDKHWDPYAESLVSLPSPTNSPADIVDHRFVNGTSALHEYVHYARNLTVMMLGDHGPYVHRHNEPTDNPLPLALLAPARPDIVRMLSALVRVFEASVPDNVRVWTSVRDLRGDDCYHTLIREGRCSAARESKTQPLSRSTSVVVRNLLRSFNAGRCVVITGSGQSAEKWERHDNDDFGEDRSVLMGAVMARSWSHPHNFVDSMMMILYVCADKYDVFQEHHIPLMRSCTDVFSAAMNVMLRSTLIP